MGNGMNKIMPGLFIGNFRDAKDMEQIKENRITHIIAIHDDAKPCLEGINYKCIDISDSPGQNISDHFSGCIEFIHKARKNGGNVLVHCIAGVSRSCTICVAYLIIVTKISWWDCILAVRATRSVVNPNNGFQKQLNNFEKFDAEKVRNNLIYSFGEVDPADTEYIKKALSSIDRDATNEAVEMNYALGTTPTFGNYERKRAQGDGDAVK